MLQLLIVFVYDERKMKSCPLVFQPIFSLIHFPSHAMSDFCSLSYPMLRLPDPRAIGDKK